ncbi:MAG TPA: hypothetical protein VMO26_08225 [Vicinamibacterales bacterium]|nr:hypothetical protein [Vicinamibacterales bacterium]
MLSCRIGLLFALAFVPAVVEAQTEFEPAWDIAGTAGLFAGHTPVADDYGYHDDWFHVAQGGIVAGRHLTRHLKIEFEATGTTRGTQYKQRLLEVPGALYPSVVTSEEATSVRSMAGAVTWQFRDNEWVHPFVQAGVSVDFDRVIARIWDPVDHSNPVFRRARPRVEEVTHRRPRALLGGGAKVYVSERAFVRTDGRFTVGRDRQDIVFRVGFGVDF